ncbi:uncharacterized protein LOC117649204 [Thrips palmi]|uniref:Uncharacterized protein LOC117649204 n=1 Tax=Thrips palmi TaxID=161013 RepID=A0A6P8ZRH5_THRPL|nr:uncharacterized protein LOC117649204 [Thrips palmi]
MLKRGYFCTTSEVGPGGGRKDSLRPLASEVSTSRDSGCPPDEALVSTSTSPAHAAFSYTHNGSPPPRKPSYPFHLVLRLRVLQIVCGLSAMVMGAVAVIEEHGELNLGLGIPAGGASVLAAVLLVAAASVHTSRGFSGYRAPAPTCGASRYGVAAWRGGAWRGALPVLLLWLLAVALHAALLGRSLLALAEPYHPQYPPHVWVPPSAGSKPTPTRTVIASLQMLLAATTLLAVGLVLHVDCRHDPGAGEGPGGSGSGVGGASSTAMSMVAVASTSSERGSRV